MKVHHCVQLSPEWFELRRGIPTASEFSRIITPARGDLSESVDSYIYELIAERAELSVPDRQPWRPTADMIRGIELEPQARSWFEWEHNIDVFRVGLITTDCGRFGCSPDGLYDGNTKGLEIKCPRLPIHAEYLARGGLPTKYRPQVHASLAISGLSVWTFLSYSPGLPPLVVHVEPDAYTERVRKAMDLFWTRFEEIAGRLGIDLTATASPATIV